MKILKFGGASLKDAESIQNVVAIIRKFYKNNSPAEILIVVSAMGKSTNALERIVQLGYSGNDYSKNLGQLYKYHTLVTNELSLDLNIDYYIDLIIQNLEANRKFPFPQYYDQVVCIGELISSTILSNYLHKAGIQNQWQDARELIITDSTWREGAINWYHTEENILSKVLHRLNENIIVTQGFIGKTNDEHSTTLGREGSDYSAAIFANILNAEGVWIWKDVPGVLNADPKIFHDAVLLPELTYYEAIEMTYNGNQVIHPKTIHPLQQKQIPLYVKSFIEPELQGTVIQADDKQIVYPPIIIIKKDQLLMSIKPSDFTFVAEEHLKSIYSIFVQHHLKINLIQIAALTISVSVDNNKHKLDAVLGELVNIYKTKINEGLELLTIRHFNEQVLLKLTKDKKIFLEQWTRNTVQFLYTL